MSDKVALIEVDNIYSPTAATNIMANFTAIVDRLNESVSRDGLAPNFMKSVLDMNGYDIINIGELLEGSGGGTSGGGGSQGSTYDLVHDGTTDQTAEFVAAIETAVASGVTFMKFLRPSVATGPLLLNERAILKAETVSNIVIDLTDIDFKYSELTEIVMQGEYQELPVSEIPTLVGNVSAGDTSITVDAKSNANLTLLNTYPTGVIRGQNDVFGNALTRETIQWTNVDVSGGLGSVVLTLASPLEFDYDETYPDSDWAPGESGIDRTLISVRVGSALTSNSLEGSSTIEADLTDFSEGDYVIVDNLSTIEYLPTGQDIRQITKISGTTAWLNRPLSRDMLTSTTSQVFKISTVDNVHIIGPKSIIVEAAPTGNRKHLIHGQYVSNCSVSDFHYDADESTYDVKGQVVRWGWGINCKTLNCSAKNRKYIESGDGYNFSSYYSNGIIISECDAYRGRHHYIVQGGSDIAVINNRSQDAGINDLDTHGVGENRIYFHGNRLLPGPTTSPDTSLQNAITIGNTRWRSASKNVVVSDNTAYNYTDAAVLIRAPSEKITVKGNDFSYCGYGVRAAIDERAGPISIDDIILHSNIYRDSVTADVDITQNEAPAWGTAEAVSGTSARPVYRTNASKLYSTTETGTTGATPPTHSSGTVSDDNINWTYVAASANRITNFFDRDTAGSGLVATNIVSNPVTTGITGATNVEAALTSLSDSLEGITFEAEIGGAWNTPTSASNIINLTRTDVAQTAGGGAITNASTRLLNTDNAATALEVRLIGLPPEDSPAANVTLALHDLFSFDRPVTQTGQVVIRGPAKDIVQLGTPSGSDGVISGLTSTAYMQVGDAVSGSGVPVGSVIVTVDSATQITIDQNTTAALETSITVTVDWAIIDGSQAFLAPEALDPFPYVWFGLKCISVGDNSTPPTFVSTERRFALNEAPLEKVAAIGNVSGALTIDLDAGSVQTMTVTDNVTSVTFSNRPPNGYERSVVIRRTMGGVGSYTWEHPTGYKTIQGAAAPGITAAAGTQDEIIYTVVGQAGDIIVRGNLDIKAP